MNQPASTDADPVNPAAPARKPPNKLARFLLIVAAILIALAIAYRLAGTRSYIGVVQRVYEKEGEYRVELRDREGQVFVAKNIDMKFPYFKLNSADLHANLHRFAQTGDFVKAKIWGFRLEWFSMFPNVVDVAFAESKKDRTRKRAERVADAAIQVLTDQGILKGGDGVRDDLVRAVSEALDPLPE